MTGKKKLILGLGKTGDSCIKFFKKNNINFKIFDTRDNHREHYVDSTNLEPELLRLSTYEDSYLDDVEEAIISPGIDRKNKIIDDLYSRKINIITDIDLFKKYSNTPIISVTGTNGKTTVVSMMEHLLNLSNYKCIACGNNGIPPLSIINNNYDYIILELSSYQLEYMDNFTSNISLITNINHDHFERHKNFDEYLSIKKKIFLNSNYSLCNIGLKEKLHDVPNLYIYGINDGSKKLVINGRDNDNLLFNSTDLFIDKYKIKYRGIHNLNNFLAALSVSDLLKINTSDAVKHLSSYSFLSHRIELIKLHNDVSWYNDSKSTNSSSTQAALEYINKNIILIIGGSKKNMNYQNLSKLINNKVKLIIFIGENKRYIDEQLNVKVRTIDAESMYDAIKISYQFSKPSDSVLLSPASPSFDMFKDYSERGAAFTKAVNDLVK